MTGSVNHDAHRMRWNRPGWVSQRGAVAQRPYRLPDAGWNSSELGDAFLLGADINRRLCRLNSRENYAGYIFFDVDGPLVLNHTTGTRSLEDQHPRWYFGMTVNRELNPGPSNELFYTLRMDDNNMLWIGKSGDNLSCRQWVGGDLTTTDVPYHHYGNSARRHSMQRIVVDPVEGWVRWQTAPPSWVLLGAGEISTSMWGRSRYDNDQLERWVTHREESWLGWDINTVSIFTGHWAPMEDAGFALLSSAYVQRTILQFGHRRPVSTELAGWFQHGDEES